MFAQPHCGVGCKEQVSIMRIFMELDKLQVKEPNGGLPGQIGDVKKQKLYLNKQ